MKKKVATLILASMVALSTVACGNNSNDSSTKTESKEVEKEPTDLTGTWTSEKNEGAWMEAIISDNTIEIDWVSDDGDTKSIYWIGTYKAPTEFVKEYSWTSERDKEKTDNALLASTDDTKNFTFRKDVISYEASAMGTTKTIELSRE